MATMTPERKRIPIASGYFTWPSIEPRLLASRCKSCDTHYFPRSARCQNPNCRHGDIEEVSLSNKGKLWSYTYILNSLPPPFRMEPFVPYGVGLVELPEGIKVLGMLTEFKLEELKVGLEVRLVIESLYKDEQYRLGSCRLSGSS
jgi:hypothetical protein